MLSFPSFNLLCHLVTPWPASTNHFHAATGSGCWRFKGSVHSLYTNSKVSASTAAVLRTRLSRLPAQTRHSSLVFPFQMLGYCLSVVPLDTSNHSLNEPPASPTHKRWNAGEKVQESARNHTPNKLWLDVALPGVIDMDCPELQHSSRVHLTQLL